MSVNDLGATVRQAIVCPEHGIPDCSPLLNGCSRLGRVHEALDELIVEAQEAAIWEERYGELLTACGGVWPG